MGDVFWFSMGFAMSFRQPYTDLTGATSANVRASYLNNPAKYNKSNFPWYSNLTITLQHQTIGHLTNWRVILILELQMHLI